MVTWKEVEPEGWDEKLGRFSDAHVRQTRAWAAHKAGGRWKPVFTGYFNDSDPLALALCLTWSKVAWVNGGPVFKSGRPKRLDLAGLDGWLEGAQRHFADKIIRLNLDAPMDVEAQLVLRQRGFKRPLAPLNTGLTYVVDLQKDLDELHRGLERNWRHQLKRAESRGPVLTVGNDRAVLERYLPLHNALVERKKLPGQRLTLAGLERMTRDLGPHITFYVVSADGRDGCGGAAWTLGDKAWLALSAADDWGLKRELPNAMYWSVIRLLKERGLRTLDVTGIDPETNWGVFNFKRGLGVPPVETLGEWEWCASPWTRRLFNAAVWLRRDKLA